MVVSFRWQESMNIIKSTIKSSYSDKLELIVKRKYKMPFSQVKSNETYVFLKLLLNTSAEPSTSSEEEIKEESSSAYRSSRVIPWPYLPPEVRLVLCQYCTLIFHPDSLVELYTYKKFPGVAYKRFTD